MLRINVRCSPFSPFSTFLDVRVLRSRFSIVLRDRIFLLTLPMSGPHFRICRSHRLRPSNIPSSSAFFPPLLPLLSLSLSRLFPLASLTLLSCGVCMYNALCFLSHRRFQLSATCHLCVVWSKDTYKRLCSTRSS